MEDTKFRRLSPEFWLLAMMLSSLVVLVLFVLYAPITGSGVDLESGSILEYRSNLLSVLLTAFGAWIGAGAAYFFGRENVREAYAGIRALQQPSFLERLQEVYIQEIPPRALTWYVGKDDNIGEIIDKLEEEPEFWFIPILSNDGRIENVIEDEAIWRYYQAQMIEEEESNPDAKIADIHEKIRSTRVGQLLEWIDADKDLEKFKDQYVSLKLDQNVYYANNMLEEKDVTLAIISDAEGKAKYFITTGDVRRTMTKMK